MVASLLKSLVKPTSEWLWAWAGRPAQAHKSTRNYDSPRFDEENPPSRTEFTVASPVNAGHPFGKVDASGNSGNNLGHLTKELIKDDEFHQAVKLLEEYARNQDKPDISGDLVLLSSKLTNSDKEYYGDRISRKSYNLERSQQGRLLLFIHKQLFPDLWNARSLMA